MYSDPIVDEVRRAREEHAKQLRYDLHAIASDLKKQEQLHSDRLVSYPPKSPQKKITA